MSKCSVCTYEGPEVSAKVGYRPTCIWCDERANAADDHQLVGDWGR